MVPPGIIIMGIEMLSSDMYLARLMHLVSPSLPTGAFAYSQGLEWAIEASWVKDEKTLTQWLVEIMKNSMTFVDLAHFSRMYAACHSCLETELENLCASLLACRETREMRTEEIDRGKALARLLKDLNIALAAKWQHILMKSQLAGFCLAAVSWNIPLQVAATGYVWSWLENQVIAGIKTIPLGQTAGHKILFDLAEMIPGIVTRGLNVADQDMGASHPALAIAGSLHETQYTRIYRS